MLCMWLGCLHSWLCRPHLIPAHAPARTWAEVTGDSNAAFCEGISGVEIPMLCASCAQRFGPVPP